MSKMLLYCTKAKPYLVKGLAKPNHTLDASNPYNFNWKLVKKGFSNDRLNGKIVAECDFKVEKIRKGWGSLNGTRYFRNSVNHYYPDYELEKQSCLSFDEINNYLKGALNENCGYAIHIQNLHIFDKPKELSDYHISYFNKELGMMREHHIEKAPQNMCKVFNEKNNYILISIRPKWLCKILNGEKTIEVRKKVLKEMLGIVPLQNY